MCMCIWTNRKTMFRFFSFFFFLKSMYMCTICSLWLFFPLVDLAHVCKLAYGVSHDCITQLWHHTCTYLITINFSLICSATVNAQQCSLIISKLVLSFANFKDYHTTVPFSLILHASTIFFKLADMKFKATVPVMDIIILLLHVHWNLSVKDNLGSAIFVLNCP